MGHNSNQINPLAGAEVISLYTRSQAIYDGVLVDVPQNISREAGFKWPLAITESLHTVLQVPDHPMAAGQSYEGRLWDVLTMCAMRIRAVQDGTAKPQTGDEERFMAFSVIVTDEHGQQKTHSLWCVLSFEGPDGGPCLTIMFPDDY